MITLHFTHRYKTYSRSPRAPNQLVSPVPWHCWYFFARPGNSGQIHPVIYCAPSWKSGSFILRIFPCLTQTLVILRPVWHPCNAKFKKKQHFAANFRTPNNPNYKNAIWQYDFEVQHHTIHDFRNSNDNYLEKNLLGTCQDLHTQSRGVLLTFSHTKFLVFTGSLVFDKNDKIYKKGIFSRIVKIIHSGASLEISIIILFYLWLEVSTKNQVDKLIQFDGRGSLERL